MSSKSRDKIPLVLYAAFVLPVDPSAWTSTRVNSAPLPKIEVQNQTWQVTAEKGAGENCALSPYSDRIVNCLLPANHSLRSFDKEPLKDLIRITKTSIEDLKVIGAWVFSDSDNLKSQCKATLNGISFR